MPLSGGTTSLVERGRWCRSDMEMIRQRGRAAEIICHIAQICQKPNSTLCLPNESTTSALTKFLRSPPFLVCCVMHKILESREVEIFKKVHIKFKIRRSILQQEQTLQNIEDDDGQPKLFISSLWYVSRESPLNLKACEFLIDFIWWIEIEILMCKFFYLGQFSRQCRHYIIWSNKDPRTRL